MKGNKERREGIKWTIQFSFDQKFDDKKNILSFNKEIVVIFEPKLALLDQDNLQPQKQLHKAFEFLKPEP